MNEQFRILKPKQAINKAFLKVKPNRADIERFKVNLTQLLDRITDAESEEFHKNLVIDFFKKTYYEPNHFVNTKGRNDLVIHNSSKATSTVGVIVEAKKPANKAEMLTHDKLNVKAFQELVLYYLRERITHKNIEIKYLVATNINQWFIFDAALFDRLFAQNKNLVKQFNDFEAGRLADTKTDFFYKQIAAPFIAEIKNEIEFTWFDIRDYEKLLRNDNKTDDVKLISLFKLLSPEHLLKLPFANDSNTLDKKFYGELLHIIGLTETKSGNKKLIERNKENHRNPGSILENAMVQLDSLDKISRLENQSQYGTNLQEKLFNVGLELSITWINRILFLKLLEAQLVTYHKGDKSHEFLNFDKIKDYDELNSLFFQVLARRQNERSDDTKTLFSKVPYLNSSLFEPTDIEHATIFVSNLRNDKAIPVYSATVLKNETGKKRTGNINPLEYLFDFLNAYDFSGEGSAAIQEDNKTLINASVLGLIFEKINGYKDGSFFTPGFITMYMCRETLRRAVVQKFNETKNWDCADINALYDKIEDRDEANRIINGLKICDPAVGSGHFLVSALNEMIAIKNDLKILQDSDGKRLKEYSCEVVNDELIVTDEDGELFEYNPANKESQRVQETLFNEKRTIIENCLFGVDINPNSVKICRLRLWIELLKNAYYKRKDGSSNFGGPKERELETLPNIDINIKYGNSLISRYALDADLRKVLKVSKYSIADYKNAVNTYRETNSKDLKREMEKLILSIKQDFTYEIRRNDPLKTKLDKLSHELYNRFTGNFIFEPEQKYGNNDKLEKKKLAEQKKLEDEINSISLKMNEIKGNKIYLNAFEWRFEFPEVLDENGDFIGFDVVVGNPPYFSLSKVKEQSIYFEKAGYQTYSKGADIYCLFYELGNKLLKKHGHLTFITSNSWLRSIYGDLLKEYFKSNLQPISLLNIEDIQVFEEATVESSIVVLQKKPLSQDFSVANLSGSYDVKSSLSEYFNKNSFDFKLPETTEWFIGNRLEVKLKNKMENGSRLLEDFDVRINFGLKTGLNEAFIIDEKQKNELINEDPNNKEIIKPIIRGRDLSKFIYEFGNMYIINAHNGVKSIGLKRIEVKKEYPAIYKHLEKYLPQIENRSDMGDHWSNLRNCAYLEDFNKEKIIWGEISDKPKFAFDDQNYFAEATTFLMTGEKLKFLLAILNSKISGWYFNLISTTTGMGTNRWKKYKILQLPIRQPSEDQEKSLESIVDKIIAKKKENVLYDTTALESQIDQLVYQLYGLTAEEIAIVERSVK
jgi:type II restriction/modification system DNA methylase subunit YeeA